MDFDVVFRLKRLLGGLKMGHIIMHESHPVHASMRSTSREGRCEVGALGHENLILA